jgi:AcrR family transcriptional regulator
VEPGRRKSARPTNTRLGRRAANISRPGAEELARIALDLFAERHFASVSIKDIGRAANVNSAMIYYYYKDKRDLFRAAIESAIDEAFGLFAKHCDTGEHETPAQAISAWFDVHVALHKRLRNVVKISLDCHGMVGNLPEANEPIKRFYRHESEILQKIIMEGTKSGIFRNVDPFLVATMISTSLDGVLARSLILKDFDMLTTVEEFKAALWLHLGFSAAKKKRPALHRRTGSN